MLGASLHLVFSSMSRRPARRFLAVTLTSVMAGLPAPAIGQVTPASDLLVTQVSTAILGGTVVERIVQTPDGFLWMIIGKNSLYRFDGRTPHRFDDLRRPQTLAVSPEGDLWLATISGQARIPASNLDKAAWGKLRFHLPEGEATLINELRFTRSGQLWVGTSTGLFRYEHGRFIPVGPRVPTRELEVAPNDHVLLTTDRGPFEIAGAEVRQDSAISERLGVKDGEVFAAIRDRLGRTWYSTPMGVARDNDGRLEWMGPHVRQPRATVIYEDLQGAVWVGKERGLFRSTPAGLELAVPSIHVRSIVSDRDGNIWVGTNGSGVYRIKARPVRMFTTGDGLPSDVIMTVLTARDGTVWTGANCGGLSRFDGSRFHTFSEAHGLSNSCVFALAEGVDGELWVGTWGGGAFRYHDGTFIQYSKREGLADDVVRGIAIARDGAVWFATDAGLSRLRDGRIRTFTTADGLPSNTVYRVFQDRAGVIWFGTRLGVCRIVDDRVERFADGPEVIVNPLGEDRDGGLLLGVEFGKSTLRVHSGRTETVTELPAPYDMLETRDGHLWFSGTALIRLQPGIVAHSRPRDEPLDYEPVSLEDGLLTAIGSNGNHSLALSRDSHTLWAATSKGLAMLDLRRWPIVDAKPRIYLTTVTIGRDTRPAEHSIVLPPGTSHFEISFSAIELTSPEKIRLQYRLDGIDPEWLDAPADSRAIYSHIPVGTRALRLRACNRHGIWDRQGAVFMVTQQPYFYQTRWFAAAMLAMGLLVVVSGYRLRVRQISRSLSARFDERFAERTRVARDLHDTLLQTVQGSKMVADHAVRNPSDHDRVTRALQQLSTWLAQATEEGRAALQSLRGSAMDSDDLVDAFRRAIEECETHGSRPISLAVKGQPREMHPIVRDEIHRIGYEALRNACVRSGGTRIEVRLEYGADLKCRISDDGTGIDAETSAAAKPGHFGLRDMRERAERIGATVVIASAPKNGTAVTLNVPGRIAYR